MLDNARVPEDYDWVRVRGGCTPMGAFKALRQLVRRDVKFAERYMPLQGMKFHESQDPGKFSVTVGAVVRLFRLNDDGRIELFHENEVNPALTFQPRLSLDGERFLNDNNGASYQLWQVSRLVLEPLIFA